MDDLEDFWVGDQIISQDREHKKKSIFVTFFKKDFLFLEGGKRSEKGREKRNINVWLPLARPLLGTWPATQACALIGNQTATLWFADLRSIHWAAWAGRAYLGKDEFSSRYADFINTHEFSFILVKIYNHQLELGTGLQIWARVRFGSQLRWHICMW